MRTRRAANSPVVLAVACVAFVAALLAGSAPTSAATDPAQFTVWGEINGLYPGADGVLEAHVLNPWDVAIEVTSVVVVAADAGPGCPGTLLHFAATTNPVSVGAHSQTIIALGVTLEAGAGDACRGATWPLTFNAQATGPDGGGLIGVNPVGPLPGTPGVIANTGVESAQPVAIGAALVLVGFLLTRTRRRRLPRPL